MTDIVSYAKWQCGELVVFIDDTSYFFLKEGTFSCGQYNNIKKVIHMLAQTRIPRIHTGGDGDKVTQITVGYKINT